MKELCDKLNKCIPCKSQADVDQLTRLLQENIEAYPDRKIYWSNEVYLNSGCNQDRCQVILLFSGDVMFVPSDDPQKSPGVVVRYKYEIEENSKGN